jgi:hypothetical protein
MRSKKPSGGLIAILFGFALTISAPPEKILHDFESLRHNT